MCIRDSAHAHAHARAQNHPIALAFPMLSQLGHPSSVPCGNGPATGSAEWSGGRPRRSLRRSRCRRGSVDLV
eukprot:13835488-Alexandrium_andersonii.AAC.1